MLISMLVSNLVSMLILQRRRDPGLHLRLQFSRRRKLNTTSFHFHSSLGYKVRNTQHFSRQRFRGPLPGEGLRRCLRRRHRRRPVGDDDPHPHPLPLSLSLPLPQPHLRLNLHRALMFFRPMLIESNMTISSLPTWPL